MDVLSLELPENTWIHSTQKQVSALRRLVDELVYLSRLEEHGAQMELSPVELNELVAQAAESFVAMAEFQGKRLTVTAEKPLRVQGNAEALGRLTAILCDNAVKYAGGDGTISLRLREEGRFAVLETENMPAQPIDQEQCEHLFERFYRADDSRSKGERSGYGIGLAIAVAIAERHGGSMLARLRENGAVLISCRLPRI